ncbi:MAG: ftsQ [Gammaproteobacteria bacterium]|jgi:cell division protein FtsQ|nr:ftsQ [Gammaproteobacteria bacterium]
MRWSEDKRQWRRSKAGAVKKSSKKGTPILKRGLSLTILSAFLLIAAIYFFMWSWFPVRHVVVQHGNATIDEEAIRTVVSPHLRRGFFRAHVHGIQADLLQLPWIKTAMVEKTWPDNILIRLSLHDAVARWNKNAYLLDNGVVCQTRIPLTAVPLPEVNSPQNDAPALLEIYYALKADLATAALNIQSLNESSTREYSVVLSNGIVLNLGDKDLQQRMRRFVKVYPLELVDKANRIAYVDLRYENGLAVGWRSDDKTNIT